MKLPKTKRTFCPTCKKHTEHKISNQKWRGLNTNHHQTTGCKKRAAQKGSRSGTGIYGTFSRPPVNSRKMCGRKTSKKVDLRFTSEFKRNLRSLAKKFGHYLFKNRTVGCFPK